MTTTPKTAGEFPMRLNKYLHQEGYCSRRKADELIEQGQVKVNGKRAVLGQKVNADDSVEVSGAVKKMRENYEYFLFNKPRGVISDYNPKEHNHTQKTALDFFKNKKLFPVGRLDKESTGLLLMTNDGRVVEQMLNPKFAHEKEYAVRVDKSLKESFLNKMSRGVNIEGYMTKPAKVRRTGERGFNIILQEGKKHQIRRMCAALGYQVKDLKRLRIMNLRITGMFPGQSRPIKQDEKIALLKSIGLI